MPLLFTLDALLYNTPFAFYNVYYAFGAPREIAPSTRYPERLLTNNSRRKGREAHELRGSRGDGRGHDLPRGRGRPRHGRRPGHRNLAPPPRPKQNESFPVLHMRFPLCLHSDLI